MTIEHKNRVEVDLEVIDPENGLTLQMEKPFDFFFNKEDGVNGVGDVTVDMTLTKAGENIVALGRTGGRVKLNCGRCLAEFEMELTPSLETAFFPPAAQPGEDGEEEDGGDVNFHDGEKLDLFPILHDHLLLAIPFKPLCMEECKGLCPKCGADLNIAPCGCKPKDPDARLGALQKLKERL